jgi:reductive dehalogenase
MPDAAHDAGDMDRWSEELRGPVPQLDVEAGFDVLDDFERFNQRNDIYSRSFWDSRVRSKRTEVFYDTYRRPLKHFRNVDGFQQRDYSFRNAAWHVPDVFAELKESADRREGFLDEYSALRDGADESIPVESPAEMASEIKRVARAFGADLVGVTSTDERWTYTHKYSAQTQGTKPNDVLSDLDNVIVVATAMDYDLVKTVPSALSGAATGLGYTHDVATVLALAQYIRNLGYRAVPSLNDTALAIPYALKAGLGEYGRHGLLITKEYGPRVRLGKVFTDLPLAHDGPTRFGVREFCEICRRCTDACPPKAIAGGAPSAETYNVSNIKGVRKWSVDAERCFSFWAGQNSDCSICIRVCPYNKDYTRFVHRLGRMLAGTSLRRLMLKLDVRLGYGRRMKAGWWWRGSQGA